MPQKPDPQLMEQVYAFVQSYKQEHRQLSPSLQEIADHCFISVTTAMRYLDRLEAQGRVLRGLGQKRAIRLLNKHGDPI